MKRFLFAAVPVICAVGLAAAAASPAETVKARQAYFQSLSDAMKGVAPLAKSFDAEAAKAETAKLAAVLATDTAPLFAAGTSDADLPGETRAKAAIWQSMDDFAAKAQVMHTAGEALVAAADAGDASAFAAAFGQMGGSCKACHDSYRLPR